MIFERIAVETVTRIAPWVAPIPTAWLVFDRTQSHLRWPVPVAVAAAVAVECLGLAATATALEFREYNVAKLKTEPKAPALFAGLLSIAYFATAVVLTVVLDIVPQAATYAPAAFPAMSLVAMALLAMRSGHSHRLTTNDAQRLERKRKRQKQTISEPERLQLRMISEPERPISEPDQEFDLHEAICKVCDWHKNGYETAASARNGLNAHMRVHAGGNGV